MLVELALSGEGILIAEQQVISLLREHHSYIYDLGRNDQNLGAFNPFDAGDRQCSVPCLLHPVVSLYSVHRERCVE